MRRVYRHRRTAAVQQGISTLPPVITFDAGQTLVELDLDFLVRRLAGQGTVSDRTTLAAALPAAWVHHDALVDAGEAHPWQGMMRALLAGAGIPNAAALVAWLWTEQPRANLWRKPIVGMVELARELVARGARVAVLSNSEGRIAELLAEIGIADPFELIVDSGRLGYHKPDPRIFHHTLTQLGIDGGASPIHIGDSWAADVVGARAVGWRALWYGRHVAPVADPQIAIARDPAAARAALVGWGVL